MARKFSLRKALSNPAVIREVADHLLQRMRSSNQTVQLKATRSLLLLTLLNVQQNYTPKPAYAKRMSR